MRRGRSLLVLGVAVLLGSIAWLAYRMPTDVPAAPPPPITNDIQAPNTPRPDFALPDLDGRRHSISEWKGKVVVLNFWATWCTPCLREMPLFVEMQAARGAQGLQFVGVAIEEDVKLVRDFVAQHKLNYPQLIGYEPAIEVAKKYGNDIGALPFTAIIDRNGIIVHTQRGEMDRAELEAVLARLLPQSPLPKT